MSTFQTGIQREQGGDKIVVATSGEIEVQTGGVFRWPYQSLGSSQTATFIEPCGATILTGTTTGPAYTLTAPVGSGLPKELILNPTSSGATHRCTVYSGSTGRAFVHHSGSGNTLTLNTSEQWGVSLISAGTTAWRVLHAYGVAEPALSNKST